MEKSRRPVAGTQARRPPGDTTVSRVRMRPVSRPSLPLTFIGTAIAFMTVALGVGSDVAIARRSVAAVLGMFVSAVVLGLFRLDINRKIAQRRFVDWRVGSLWVGTSTFWVSWLAGLASLWMVALDWSRQFT